MFFEKIFINCTTDPLLKMVANQDPAIAEGEFEEVEEGIHATSRYSSFMRRQRASRWSLDETRAFYRVSNLPSTS